MEPLREATLELLARRREVLAAGGRHVGWKLGVGERESIEGSIAVGYLTSATLLEAGATHRPAFAADLHADVELAVEIDAEARPVAFATALELVDLAPVLSTPQAVIAANVFHRAVAFGSFRPDLPEQAVHGSAIVDGEVRDRGEVADVLERLHEAGAILAGAGERLRAGDRVITGSIAQVPIGPRNRVRAEISGLGSVELVVAVGAGPRSLSR